MVFVFVHVSPYCQEGQFQYQKIGSIKHYLLLIIIMYIIYFILIKNLILGIWKEDFS